MIKITNESAEDFEIVSKVDPHMPGRRVLHPPVNPELLPAGQSVTFLGYEPGVYFHIQPVSHPEVPRSDLTVGPSAPGPSTDDNGSGLQSDAAGDHS